MGILFKNLEEEVLARPIHQPPPPPRSEQLPPPPPKSERVAAAAVPPPPPRPAYSIDDAISLMRSLPLEQNEEIVVRVVRSVWTTMRVSVKDIVADAERKEKDLADRSSQLNDQLKDLENQLSARREQIRSVEQELREVTATRARLEKAEMAAEKAEEISADDMVEATPSAAPSSTRARITREEVVVDPSAQPTVLLSNRKLATPTAPRRA